MSDDLEAQIEHNSMTDSCYKDKVISTPLVLQLVKAYLGPRQEDEGRTCRSR